MVDYYFVALLLGLARHCYTDWRYFLLYDSTNAFLLAVGLVRGWHLEQLEQACQGFLLLGGLMLLIYYAARGGMGEGDVKLAAVLGLWLGVEQGLASLLLAFVSGALGGGLVLLLKGAQPKLQLPFGPFLAGSGLACYLYGAELIGWYSQFFC